jgi:hypothetical protein
MRPALVITIIVLGLALGACGDKKEHQMRTIDEVAAQARRDIDALAARLGSDPEVREDVITDCIPGRKDSGKDLIYTIHVTVKPGALDRLRSEIADELHSDGWTVKEDAGSDSVRFAKGGATMGASVWEDLGKASVGGSGGCVK